MNVRYNVDACVSIDQIVWLHKNEQGNYPVTFMEWRGDTTPGLTPEITRKIDKGEVEGEIVVKDHRMSRLTGGITYHVVEFPSVFRGIVFLIDDESLVVGGLELD